MQKKPKSEYFLRIFCGRANAGQTLAGKHRQHNCGKTQANKMQAGRRTGCQQLPVTPTHFRPHIFLYREPKFPPCSSFPYGASGAGHYLVVATLRWRITNDHLPQSSYRHLCYFSSAFPLRKFLSFIQLHFAIQKYIRISKLFICIRLLAIEHSHHLF